MDLSHLFSSSSKYRILQALSARSTPLHLRALAEVANVQLRSAQLAVAALLKEKVVTKVSQENRSMITLNLRSKYAEHLRSFFKMEQKRLIAARSETYNESQNILERIDELRALTWSVQS